MDVIGSGVVTKFHVLNFLLNKSLGILIAIYFTNFALPIGMNQSVFQPLSIFLHQIKLKVQGLCLSQLNHGVGVAPLRVSYHG
jgi:hypothetical protein